MIFSVPRSILPRRTWNLSELNQWCKYGGRNSASSDGANGRDYGMDQDSGGAFCSQGSAHLGLGAESGVRRGVAPEMCQGLRTPVIKGMLL